MAIYRFRQFALTGGGNARAVVAGAVGAGFFEIVRARPALGRVFLPEEDTPGRSRVVDPERRILEEPFRRRAGRRSAAR